MVLLGSNRSFQVVQCGNEGVYLFFAKAVNNLAAKVGEATKHLGHSASALERRGEKTELGDLNRDVKERNREREKDADLASGVLDRLTQKQ